MSATTRDSRQLGFDLFAPAADPANAASDEATAMRWQLLAEEHAIAEAEFEAEWPEGAREDDPADDEAPVIQPPADCLPPDELGDRIVAAGLAPNSYLLELNGITSPTEAWDWPWNLPSRMFRYPVETAQPCLDRDGTHHPRQIGLRHPLLAAHPFAQQVEQELGITLAPDGAPNPHGYTSCRNALWWHAVDLVCAGHWEDLLKTREFTTVTDIINAVAYGLDYGPHSGPGKGKAHLTTTQARALLDGIGAHEPSDPGPEEALQAVEFDESGGPNGKPQQIIRWMLGPGNLANTWGRIHGIERGWLKPGEFLRYTPKGKQKEGALL